MNLNQLSLKNIKSFIEGNYRFYKDKIHKLPEFTKEQYYYRLYLCKDDCLITGRCIICACPTVKKAFSTESCNPDRILKLMSGGEWRSYKKDHNITDELLLNIKKIIDEQISNK